MTSNSELRARARQQLGGNIFSTNWLMGLVVVLISGAILSALSFTVVGSLILTGPIMVGVSLVFVSLARGKGKVDFMDLFVGFRESDSIGNRILTGLLTSVFTFLWSLLFVIPGIVKFYSYSMALYISMDHPDWDWKRCIDASKKVMNGKKGKLFCLDLSFIGWMIVGSLAFGVGTLWVAAYMQSARANFYEDIKAEIA